MTSIWHDNLCCAYRLADHAGVKVSSTQPVMLIKLIWRLGQEVGTATVLHPLVTSSSDIEKYNNNNNNNNVSNDFY